MIVRLQKILSGTYIRNVSWMAGAEVANRVIRLACTVILARTFSSQDYGLMAIVYTLNDFFQVLTLRGGIGSKIIQADKQDISTICNTAYWLGWITCSSLFVIQCLVALLLPYFSNNQNLTLPLIAVAFTYFAYPLFTIHLTLIERENRFKHAAICNVAVSLVTSITTATLALMGMGIWSIVWSMILASPVWILCTWKYHSWRPPLRFSLEGWQEVLGFGSSLLITNLLNRIRANVDYLIVGRYLGVDALGTYYFAFNAGSGITISLLNTFMSPMYPYICAVKNDYQQFRERYFSSLKKVSLILVPLILLQSFLAPIYVPIIFGSKWTSAIPILILICLSVIPRIYAWAAYLLLNAINKPVIALRISSIFTAIFILSLLIVVKAGIVWVAATVFICNFTLLFGCVSWIHKFALNNKHF
ncbi:MAG: lipopolysaccharide biosynthesis protein [Cyanobacteria bacterium P01_A01_bin.40]